ncbi:uncharacterized protein LOC115325313, partial [Ixodes scapularis]|uniref:uncharacterized protein LOC115325313 n=1 Tax=Ixodes scapularis TaxID=6945 RepID=UPI001A9F5915
MNAMIPTKWFLVFAMMPIMCLMEHETLPEGCVRVNLESFPSTDNIRTLQNALGLYCNASYSNKGLAGNWIGIAGPALPKCEICCVRKNENETLLYRITQAPNRFPSSLWQMRV